MMDGGDGGEDCYGLLLSFPKSIIIQFMIEPHRNFSRSCSLFCPRYFVLLVFLRKSWWFLSIQIHKDQVSSRYPETDVALGSTMEVSLCRWLGELHRRLCNWDSKGEWPHKKKWWPNATKLFVGHDRWCWWLSADGWALMLMLLLMMMSTTGTTMEQPPDICGHAGVFVPLEWQWSEDRVCKEVQRRCFSFNLHVWIM